MRFQPDHLIIWLPLLPLITAVFVGLITKKFPTLSAVIALSISMVVLLLVLTSDTLVLPWKTTSVTSAITFTKMWIPDVNLNVFLVLDGYAGWMILMTLLVTITCLLFATFVESSSSWRRPFSILLILAGTIGVFLSRDFLTFLFAWGSWLIIPFVIDTRRSDRHRPPGYIKFFVFHLLSVLCLSAAFALIHFLHFDKSGIQGFDVSVVSRIPIPVSTQRWLLPLMMIGFGTRMALFPFHGWLSDALDEMPVSVTAMLASTGLATSIAAFLRVCVPLCPIVCIESNKYIIFIALLSMVYGALVALMNPHLLQRTGFVCMSYAGLHLLGVFTLNPTGYNGAAVLSANFILTISLLILAFGWITSKTNSVLIQDMGGLWKKYPVIAVIVLLISMACVGVPGLNMFPGLFLIISGIIQTQPAWAALALAIFLILATSILWLFQKVFTGKESPVVESLNPADDVVPGRILIPVTALIIWFGFFPQYMIRSFSEPTDIINRYLQSQKMLKKTSPGMTPMEHFFRQHSDKKE